MSSNRNSISAEDVTQVVIKQVDPEEFVFRVYSVVGDKIQAIFTDSRHGIRLWWVYDDNGKALSRHRRYKSVDELLSKNNWKL